MPENVLHTVIAKYGKFPIGLVGCKTTDYALECCEYDFVVLCDEDIHELLTVNDAYAEIYAIDANEDPYVLAPLLQNVHIINDPSWIFRILKQNVDSMMSKGLSAYASNRAMDALFYANRSREVVNGNIALSSVALKCAAYYYLEAVIARNGMKPMPTHMLAQIRSFDSSVESEGITTANICLGLERANRSSLTRCIEAAIELNKRVMQDHTTDIVIKKAQFMLNKSMYTDCYFYLGYVAKNAAVKVMPSSKTLKNYQFLLGIAMDLTMDQSFVTRFSNELVHACNAFLLR